MIEYRTCDGVSASVKFKSVLKMDLQSVRSLSSLVDLGRTVR